MKRNISARRKFFWLTLFAAAFALVEAAVVIYLRKLLQVEGSNINLFYIPQEIYFIETAREVATLVLLLSVGFLAGQRPMGRFGSFIIAFGIWDILYYVWLATFHNWPKSLLDWDLLFLVPQPWMAPILAPVLVSVGLVFCGYWLLMREEKEKATVVSITDWLVETGAASLILYSFMSNDGSTPPEVFSWVIFLAGLALGVGYFVWRMMQSSAK